MATRKIVTIDEDKCTGCGLCVPSCAEGAIQIVDGKAKLIGENLCDGLGACLGDCPEDAIRIEEREAEDFDEVAVQKHLENKKLARGESRRESQVPGRAEDGAAAKPAPAFACPGMALKDLRGGEPALASEPKAAAAAAATEEPSRLQNWPIQLGLVPIAAPWFQDASLAIAADCVPFAYAGFHERFLAAQEGENRPLLIGCPKLDDPAAYEEKLTQIFARNDILSVEVLYMEVPCCHGLVRIVENALAKSGKDIPLRLTQIGIRGGIRD